MKNKIQNKNAKNKGYKKLENNPKAKNQTFFNKSIHPKKEETKNINNKDIKAQIKLKNEIRVKSSRSIYSYKLNFSRNFNDYRQILTELTDINNAKINWAIKLRKDQLINILDKKIAQSQENPNKNEIRKLSSAKPATRGLILTSNFKEPKFYIDDLEKFKSKIKNKKRPLSSALNPNFNNIKHLFTNKLNHQSKEFAASLRNYQSTKNKNVNNKWNNYFTSNKNYNPYYTRFLLPKTDGGKKNFRKVEKNAYSPFSVTYKEVVLGNDTIKQKILTPKKDFSYGGIGNYLDLGNYRTNYGIKNSGLSENILKTESNSHCLFELGLRNYPKIKIKS